MIEIICESKLKNVELLKVKGGLAPGGGGGGCGCCMCSPEESSSRAGDNTARIDKE